MRKQHPEPEISYRCSRTQPVTTSKSMQISRLDMYSYLEIRKRSKNKQGKHTRKRV